MFVCFVLLLLFLTYCGWGKTLLLFCFLNILWFHCGGIVRTQTFISPILENLGLSKFTQSIKPGVCQNRPCMLVCRQEVLPS